MFSRQVCLMGFFRRVKQTKPNTFVVQFNFGFPALVLSTHAGVTRLVVFSFSVLRVFGVRSLSQIAQPIVRPIIVDMIDLMRRPNTVNVQPSKPVGRVQHVVKADANIAVAHSTSCRVARTATPSSFVPCKFSRIRVVVDQFAQTLLGKLFSVHDLNNIRQGGVCQVGVH